MSFGTQDIYLFGSIDSEVNEGLDHFKPFKHVCSFLLGLKIKGGWISVRQ